MNQNPFLILIFFTVLANCQVNTNSEVSKYTKNNKGKFFISWGGNRDQYTKSDIHFEGADYNFTLKDVHAHDVPKGWHVDYINPLRMTIPQTNFKLGYFFSYHYSASFGFDHMKYVLTQNQVVNYEGTYPNMGAYGEYSSPNEVMLSENFITYEHTDGLNYVNIELARHDDFSSLIGITNTDVFQTNSINGIGTGILFPRTDSRILGKERHDNFHVAGYGVSLKSALNLTFFKYFYIQGEMKVGYINMPDIRTTNSKTDSASQDFFFFQKIISVGGIFRL